MRLMQEMKPHAIDFDLLVWWDKNVKTTLQGSNTRDRVEEFYSKMGRYLATALKVAIWKRNVALSSRN